MEALLKLKLRKKVLPNVRKPQRKRGYHDHGALRPRHTWKPSSDYSLTEKQNEIEEKRSKFSDTITFLKGLIT